MVEPSRLPRMFYLPEHSLLRSRYNWSECVVVGCETRTPIGCGHDSRTYYKRWTQRRV